MLHVFQSKILNSFGTFFILIVIDITQVELDNDKRNSWCFLWLNLPNSSYGNIKKYLMNLHKTATIFECHVLDPLDWLFQLIAMDCRPARLHWSRDPSVTRVFHWEVICLWSTTVKTVRYTACTFIHTYCGN